MNKPNIVLVVLDTLRVDRVFGRYRDINLTPYIESLLDKSIYFKSCIANSPWTLPSHFNMFTGLYQTQTALINNKLERLSNKIPILPEILKDLGYSTICYTENAFISKQYGLTRGFDQVVQAWDWDLWMRKKNKMSIISRLFYKIDGFLEKKVKSKLILKIWEHFYNRTKIVIKYLLQNLFLDDIVFKLKNNTIKELEEFNKLLRNRMNDKPNFIFLNFLTTHDPYVPLKETLKLFDIHLEDFKIIRGMLVDSLKYRLDINIKSKRLSEKQIAIIEKLYNACVYSADIIVKNVFSLLKNIGFLDNSFIIITSDHGEHLGNKDENYYWEHNTYQSLHGAVMRVPLQIFNKNFNGKIINEQVQLKDLFHTILDMTGVPLNQNKYLIKERSILYQINNQSTPKYIYAEYPNPKKTMYELINAHRRNIDKNLLKRIYNDVYLLRSNEFKLITYNNTTIKEFYNHVADPNEQNNIIKENILELSKMTTVLKNRIEFIKNPEHLKQLISYKEKDSVKRIISKLKISGI